MNIKDDFILKNIHEGYLVGGYVRDFLMGLEGTRDRDIAIKGAEKFAKELSKKFDATFIVLDSENKIYRIVLNDKENYLDITEMQGESIEEDLLRRDLTINAIAYNLENDEFIDIANGIDDIKNKKLRSIKEKNFKDDPLRLLRAYRFMSATGFEPDENLEMILNKYKDLIKLPAKERIHDEIMKLFGGKYCSKTLLKMYENGFLSLIFPQVEDMKKVPPNSHHHLDLVHHVIEVVNQIEQFYEDSSPEVKNHLDNIDFGGYPRINHLKLAGFLHDIGKPATWAIEKIDGKEKHRFIKHDIEGAKIAVPFLKSLKFSNKQIDYITYLIKNHMYPSAVVSSPKLDDKVMMRYIRKSEDNAIDNIILAKADRMSAQGPEVTKEMTEENIDGLNKLLNFYITVKPTLKPIPKLLDGNEVMKILGISPSKELGKIMDALHEAQVDGEINTKNDAVEFVKTAYKKSFE